MRSIFALVASIADCAAVAAASAWLAVLCAARWLLGIPSGGLPMVLLGAVGLGSVNWVVHQTSSTRFCVACHSHPLPRVAEARGAPPDRAHPEDAAQTR